MEDRRFKIYVLTEPDGITIRYVGYTGKTLDERLNGRTGHIREVRYSKNKTYKINWINSLLKENLKPIIIQIEDELTLAEAKIAEVQYIKILKELGIRLVNGTPGGDGNSNPSTEMIEKIRQANLGNKYACGERTSEFKEGCRKRQLGKKYSEETKNKHSKTLKEQYKNGRKASKYWEGKHLSQEMKDKMSKTMKESYKNGRKRLKYWEGKHLSQETKDKLSEIKIGISWGNHYEETKKILSVKKLGNKNPQFGKSKHEIEQIDPLTEIIINTFHSVTIAGKLTGINYVGISAVCRGVAKTAGGFIWKYKNEQTI